MPKAKKVSEVVAIPEQILTPVAVDLKDPKWRYEERVKRQMGKGMSRPAAEELVRTVILEKEQDTPHKPKMSPGVECRLKDLEVGQRFRCQEKPYFEYTGALTYLNETRARVLLDSRGKTTKAFTAANGEAVEFDTSGRVYRNMSPSTEVTVIEGTENVQALLSKGKSVQSAQSGLTNKSKGAVMAKKAAVVEETKGAKKAAKPAKAAAATNGAEKTGRAPKTVKLLKFPKEGELKGQALAILEVLKAGGKKMTTDAIIEGLEGKVASKNVLGLKDVWAMNRKKLIDNGFIEEVA